MYFNEFEGSEFFGKKAVLTKLALSLFVMHLLIMSVANADTRESQIMTFDSPESGGALVELYTSEGCSSCPPAERWFSRLSKDKRLWTQLFPVAFHVDYWDYLGWRDPFSSSTYSLRQRAYEHYGHTSNVATPGFVVDGKGWNGWFRGRSLPAVNNTKNVGRIHAELDGWNMQVNYSADANIKKPKAHLVVLGFDIEIPVKGGENGGRNLVHDFVVLGYRSSYLIETKGDWLSRLQRPDTRQYEQHKQALVVWVSDGEDPKAIQVAGGWL